VIIDTEDNIISTQEITDIEDNHDQGSLILKIIMISDRICIKDY
jgi:hypothetical protein